MFTAKHLIAICGLKMPLYRQLRNANFIRATKEAAGTGYSDEYDEIDIAQTLLFLRIKEAGFKRSEASEMAFHPAARRLFESASKVWVGRSLHRRELRGKDPRYREINVLVGKDLAAIEAESILPDLYLVFYGEKGVAYFSTEAEFVALYPILHGADVRMFNLSGIIQKVILDLIRLGEDPFGLLALAESRGKHKAEEKDP
jgi:hypothetical protein